MEGGSEASLDDEEWLPCDPEDDVEFPLVPATADAPVVGKPSPGRVAATSASNGGESPSDAPHFVVNSGVLLWGHLPRIFEGARREIFDDGTRGTPLSFRCAARNGKWIVRKAFSNAFPENDQGAEPTRHFGFLISHESLHPDEVVEKCCKWGPARGKLRNKEDPIVGKYVQDGDKNALFVMEDSQGESGESEDDTDDKNVVEVGRYDWSWLQEPEDRAALQQFIHQATGARLREPASPYLSEDLLVLRTRWGGYFMALDGAKFGPAVVQSLVRDCRARRGAYLPRAASNEVLFFERSDDGTVTSEAFGAWVACDWTEYEYAYLVFSGRNHEIYPEARELVAILYDGAYTRLEGSRFRTEP